MVELAIQVAAFLFLAGIVVAVVMWALYGFGALLTGFVIAGQWIVGQIRRVRR